MSAPAPFSALYAGEVMHRRLRPRAHRLRYRLFSLLLDLDELTGLCAGLRLLSHNRFNVFAVHDRDYGDGSATPLRTQIERHLAAAGLDLGGGPIRLLTIPRLFGYAFNPLNVWFCHRADGELGAMLYEVHNTFGQRHSYLAAVAPGARVIRQHSDKTFHVSPFLPMAMRYAFRVTPPDAARDGSALQVAITASDADGPVLSAVQTATRRRLSDARLLRAVAAYPLLTLKVSAAILWEALLLWRKRIPLHRLPAAPAGPVTLAHDRSRGAAPPPPRSLPTRLETPARSVTIGLDRSDAACR